MTRDQDENGRRGDRTEADDVPDHDPADQGSTNSSPDGVPEPYGSWFTLRRAFGAIGTVLLGAALAWAPVAAFTGGMSAVMKLGLAGVAFLIVMKLLPRRDAGDRSSADGSASR
jgi:hypothetical protein